MILKVTLITLCVVVTVLHLNGTALGSKAHALDVDEVVGMATGG